MNITDPRFKYTNASATSVLETFKKHGWKPTTPAERAARQQRCESRPVNVTPLRKVAK